MTKAAPTIDLVTARLRLHHLTVEEGRRILAGTPTDGDRWDDEFPRQDDRDGVNGFLHAAAAHGDLAPFGNYRVDLDEVAVGTIGFFGPPNQDGEVHLGYGLVERARGRGYATEAVARLVELCRAHPHVRAMLADTETPNTASQRVLAKNGFVCVREDPELCAWRLDLD
jgi:RimJ/RimL family protein N-acetyltransferase